LIGILKKYWPRIGVETVWLALGQALVALGGLVAIRVLTGFYAREVYGLSWLFINGAGLAVLLFAGPIGQALNRFYHDEGGQEQLDRLLGLVWRLEVIVILVIGLTYAILILFFGAFKSSEWMAFGIMPVYFFSLSFINMAQSLLNTSRKRAKRVVLMVVDAFLKPTFAVTACLLFDPSVNSFVTGYALASILTGSIGMSWMSGYGSRSPFKLPAPEKEIILKVLAYSLPWGGIAGCGWIIALSDRYLVNLFWGAALTGTYVAAYQVGSALFQFLGGVFGPLVQPLIFQRASEPEACARNISTVFKAFAWIGLPVLSVFALMYGWLLRWLVAPAYWGAEGIVLIVGVGIFFWVLGDRALDVFLLAKKTGLVLMIYAFAALVNIVLNLLLIWKYGAFGAAVATLLGYFCYASCMIFFSRKLLAWKLPLKTFVLVGGISAASYTVGQLVHVFVFNGKYDLFSAVGTAAVFGMMVIACLWAVRSRVYLETPYDERTFTGKNEI
jgi:O-antigen/teichoic acid export membrane protein